MPNPSYRRQVLCPSCQRRARFRPPPLLALGLGVLAGLAVTATAVAYHPECNVVRGIYIHAADAVYYGPWHPYGKAGQPTDKIRRSGRFSLMCDNGAGGPGSGSGMSQTVEVNQREPRPIKIAGWSRAEGVEGERGWQYSLYVDFILADGTPWFMKTASFSTGTHDWEYSETIVTPPKPVKSARFYAFLREYPGRVWFDDLFFGEADGPNLLQAPGFEPDANASSHRQTIFDQWKAWHANAMHIYLSHRSPLWPTELVDSVWTAGKSPLETFLADAAKHGIGVWVTPAPLHRPISSADDPNFPQYYCPNSRWGDDWLAVLADLARFDLAGISLVPDEYNYANGRLKRRFAKHPDPTVRQFYKNMASYCECPGCKRLFRARYGLPLPDLHRILPTDAYRCYINFRYDVTTRWLKKAADTVKRVNPQCLADSLICVTPVCSDHWWGPGVAWDRVGYDTRIDFLTTDPYILLHNYLGDSTHWYVTETALRLSGASPRHVCGVVLEPCRLRREYRELDPVEVYGAALTAVWHGAREVFYFHHVHISGRSGVAADPSATQRNVSAAYAMLEAVDPWLQGARPWPGIALLHSRASEDWWRFYCLDGSRTPAGQSSPLTHPSREPRYASLAQVEPLMALLRCGLPVDLFYLDSVRFEQLRSYPIVLVPFPFAVPDGAAKLLGDLAQAGKRVVVISETGALQEDGKVRKRPALLELLGLADAPSGAISASIEGLSGVGTTSFSVYERVRRARETRVLATASGVPVVLERRVGRGSVCFLAGEFGAGLPVDYSNWHRGRDRRVYPPALSRDHLAVLLRALFGSAGPPSDMPRLTNGGVPGARDDVEAAYMVNDSGDLLVLIINWRQEAAEARVKLPAKYVRVPYNGRQIGPHGRLRPLPVSWTESGELAVALAPQTAAVVRLVRRR